MLKKLSNNKKWTSSALTHLTSPPIGMIVSKASKRLHNIRVLRRGGVIIADLVAIYVALVRSVLEYCCVVWHDGPSRLSFW